MNSNNGNFGTGGGMTGSTTSTGERTDWLDKGIQKVGNKLGMNVSNNNADKAGDALNKMMGKKEGHSLPGVR